MVLLMGKYESFAVSGVRSKHLVSDHVQYGTGNYRFGSTFASENRDMPNCIFCENENSGTLTQCQKCGAPLPPVGSDRLDEKSFRSQLLELVTQGQKTQAIAAYQRRTGAGLTAAQEYIDGLDSDQEFALASPIADVEWEVGKMLERGEKIEAVKVYRERTGVSLKMAKDEVEALEIRLGLASEAIDPKAGCAGMLLFLGAGWITLCLTLS